MARAYRDCVVEAIRAALEEAGDRQDRFCAAHSCSCLWQGKEHACSEIFTKAIKLLEEEGVAMPEVYT